MTIKRLLWRRTPGFILEHRSSFATGIHGHDVSIPHARLYKDGLLVLSTGYEWDGPSGPTIKTASTMRASAVHDALYRMIRGGMLPRNLRAPADLELRKLMLRDNAGRIRAWYFWLAVRLFGWRYV